MENKKITPCIYINHVSSLRSKKKVEDLCAYMMISRDLGEGAKKEKRIRRERAVALSL